MSLLHRQAGRQKASSFVQHGPDLQGICSLSVQLCTFTNSTLNFLIRSLFKSLGSSEAPMDNSSSRCDMTHKLSNHNWSMVAVYVSMYKQGFLLQGRMCLLLGPPGSGKSSLLKILAGKIKNSKLVQVTRLIWLPCLCVCVGYQNTTCYFMPCLILCLIPIS